MKFKCKIKFKIIFICQYRPLSTIKKPAIIGV